MDSWFFVGLLAGAVLGLLAGRLWGHYVQTSVGKDDAWPK